VKAIHGQGGQVTDIELKLCSSVYDREGRFSPAYDESQTRTIAADTVIAAIGQTTDLSFISAGMKSGARIIADPDTLATSMPGVFAGGDMCSADRSIVHAVASGKRAAISIDIFLTGGDMKVLTAVGKGAVSMRSYLKSGQALPETVCLKNRKPLILGPVSARNRHCCQWNGVCVQ
jgi:NADH dehydrogenase FAD-containing subunit